MGKLLMMICIRIEPGGTFCGQTWDDPGRTAVYPIVPIYPNDDELTIRIRADQIANIANCVPCRAAYVRAQANK